MIRKTTRTKLPTRKPRRKGNEAGAAETTEQNGKRKKVHPAIALIEDWLHDESGYDEEAWPALKKALDKERARVGARRLFDG